MFQFIRRVSGSFFPRPDRPWSDDATSHAPTIGRKRTYSVIERDEDDSPATTKRTRSDPVKPDAECDSASEGGSPVGGQEVKEVTRGVKEVDLDDGNQVEDASSIRPEGVPLPDSPSGSPAPESPEPEPTEPDVGEEAKDQEHAGDRDSVASSAPEDDAKEEVEDSDRAEEEEEAPPTNDTADKTTPAREIIIAPLETGLREAPETLEVKA